VKCKRNNNWDCESQRLNDERKPGGGKDQNVYSIQKHQSSLMKDLSLFCILSVLFNGLLRRTPNIGKQCSPDPSEMNSLQIWGKDSTDLE
jgi:hypothetical protein